MTDIGRTHEGGGTVSLAELRHPGQRATIEIAGGSGYGPPQDRPLARVQADLDEGYITDQGVPEYGATVSRQGRVERPPALGTSGTSP